VAARTLEKKGVQALIDAQAKGWPTAYSAALQQLRTQERQYPAEAAQAYALSVVDAQTYARSVTGEHAHSAAAQAALDRATALAVR